MCVSSDEANNLVCCDHVGSADAADRASLGLEKIAFDATMDGSAGMAFQFDTRVQVGAEGEGVGVGDGGAGDDSHVMPFVGDFPPDLLLATELAAQVILPGVGMGLQVIEELVAGVEPLRGGLKLVLEIGGERAVNAPL
jgi:hypothetical protein